MQDNTAIVVQNEILPSNLDAEIQKAVQMRSALINFSIAYYNKV